MSNLHNTEWAYTPRKLTECLREGGMKDKVEENEMMQMKLRFVGGYVCGIFHIFHQVCVAWY